MVATVSQAERWSLQLVRQRVSVGGKGGGLLPGSKASPRATYPSARSKAGHVVVLPIIPALYACGYLYVGLLVDVSTLYVRLLEIGLSLALMKGIRATCASSHTPGPDEVVNPHPYALSPHLDDGRQGVLRVQLKLGRVVAELLNVEADGGARGPGAR